MPRYEIAVDGTIASNVTDVEYDKPLSDEIGQATIDVVNTQTNRDLFTPGARVDIRVEDADNPGTFVRDWRGEVISKPSNASNRNLTLSVSAETRGSQAAGAKVSRPFIERTNSEIVDAAVTEQVDPESAETTLHKAESLTDWSTNARDFELLDTVADVTKVGNDSIYFGIRPGATGVIYAEYTGGPTVTGRSLDRLDTRLLIADKGGTFDGRVILVDGDDIQYTWELELTGRAENRLYQLPVEDADITTSPDYATGMLRYEIITAGNVPDERAFAIDSATAVTFTTNTRDTDLSANVEATSFRTTRRIEASVLEVANQLATESGYVAYVDEDDVLNFVPSGGTPAPIGVDRSNSGQEIIEFTVDRNFDVTNVVTIQGKGNVRGTFESSQSIQFYNERSPKEDVIDDVSIRTREQARQRGRGFLQDNAFEDGAITFTSSNPDYRDVRPGQLLPVTWPPEGIDDDFVVSSIETTADGYTTIALSGNVTL